MKSVIYINRGKVWSDGRSFDWNWKTLDEIFVSIRRDLKVNEVRIVLGSDISYVVDFKLVDISKSRREDVLKMTKGWLPFMVTDECFDWKMVALGESDIWAQVIAVEPNLLSALSQAIEKSGMKVEWMVPVGIVLGMVSLGREVPVVIKWRSKEELVVLAQNGLVDYVGKDSDDIVNSYAKQKWHLEVNPEQLLLNDDNFKFDEEVFLGKNRGNDREVLGLNLLKKRSPAQTIGMINESVEPMERKTGSQWWLVLILIALICAVILGGVLYFRAMQGGSQIKVPSATSPTPAVTENITPSASPTAEPVIDLTPYKVQVLNASGVAGVAGNEANSLTSIGFVNVVTGNSPTLAAQTTVSYKSSLPALALAKAMDTLSGYEIGNVLFLTNDQPYDLVIVVGSSTKK